MTNDEQQVWTASCRSGGRIQLHTSPNCAALQKANEIYGPKPRSVYSSDSELCSLCTGERKSRGGWKEIQRKLANPEFGPEDIGLD